VDDFLALLRELRGDAAASIYVGGERAMRQTFTASVWQEGEWYVAQCREVDVASQGQTEDEALENLRDALELHFTPPVATVVPQLRTVEVDIAA
jgi:hypothetical protein